MVESKIMKLEQMKEYNKTKSEENKCLFQDENSENKINPQAEEEWEEAK